MLRQLKWVIVLFTQIIRETCGILISRDKQKLILGSSLYKNALYLIVNNLVVPLTSFVFWIIVAKFYSTENVGLASAAISMVTLLGMFSTIGFEFGIIRYLAHAGNNANRMVNTSFTIGVLATIIFSCIFLVGINVWSPALTSLRQNLNYFATFILYSVVITMTILVGHTFIAQRRANFSMIISLISGLLRLPLPIILVLFMPSYVGILTTQVISGSIALIIGLLFFLPRTLPGFHLTPSLNRPLISEMIRFSFSNYIANMVLSFTIYVLPIMVVSILDAESNAYFFIAWTIGGVLGTIQVATTTSLFAEGSSNENTFISDIWGCFKMTYFLLIPLAVIVFLAADKLLLIFGTAYSVKGAPLLRTMCISVLPLSLNGIYFSILRVKNRTKTLIILASLLATITLVISYLFLARIGIIATGIGWLTSQTIVAFFVIIRFIRLKKTGQI